TCARSRRSISRSNRWCRTLPTFWLRRTARSVSRSIPANSDIEQACLIRDGAVAVHQVVALAVEPDEHDLVPPALEDLHGRVSVLGGDPPHLAVPVPVPSGDLVFERGHYTRVVREAERDALAAISPL